MRQVETLRQAVRATRAERPFHIDAWVVLPDHMHCVWTLPEGDAGYALRMGAIKGRFSAAVRRSGLAPTPVPLQHNPFGARGGRARVFRDAERVGASPDLRGVLGTSGMSCAERAAVAARVGTNPALRDEVPIWQKRYWEHHIRDETDYAAHVRYCWINPVKHGFVERPQDWAFSSYRREVGDLVS